MTQIGDSLDPVLDPVLDCAYIQANATGLCALACDDPERRATELHAEGCPACAAALAQGRLTLQWLDEAAVFMAAKDGASAARLAPLVHQRMIADTQERRRWQRVPPALLLAQGGLLMAWYDPQEPPQWVHATLLITMAVSGLWTVLATERAAMNRWIAAGLFAASLASAATFAHSGPSDVEVGLHCLGFELACAGMPWMAAAWLLRRERFDGPARIMAMHGLAGSLVGQAVLVAACPAQSSVVHVLGFHVVGIVVATLLGFGLGSVPRFFAQPVA